MQRIVTKPTILVIGASGQQGGAVAQKLIDSKKSFRTLSRKPERLNGLAAQGIDVIEGSLHDRELIGPALHGIKQAFLVTTPFEEGPEEEVRNGINFVDSALEAGVEHLVFSSVAAADQNTGIPHFESKWKIEQHIQQTGIPATILRPVFFMENFGSPWFLPSIQQGTFGLPVRPNVVMQMVCLDVIGAFAAKAFESPDQMIGQTIELASDALTFPQAMEKISKHTREYIAYRELPSNESEGEFGYDFAKMFSWFNEKGFSVDIDGLKKFNIPLTNFDTYLAHADWIAKI